MEGSGRNFCGSSIYYEIVEPIQYEFNLFGYISPIMQLVRYTLVRVPYLKLVCALGSLSLTFRFVQIVGSIQYEYYLVILHLLCINVTSEVYFSASAVP